MSLPGFPFLPDFRKENLDAEDQLIDFVKAVLKWKLEHEKLDAEREDLQTKLIERDAEREVEIRKLLDEKEKHRQADIKFFEWLDAFNLNYPLNTKQYEEKKKGLGLNK